MDSEQETAARVDLDVLMEQMRGYPPTRIAEAMWGWMEAQGFRGEAHAPTDDDQEALRIAELNARQAAYRKEREDWFVDHEAEPEIASNAFFRGWDAAVGGGFRRSEVPEPSGEDQGLAASCHLCVGAGGHEGYDGEWIKCSCQRTEIAEEPEWEYGVAPSASLDQVWPISEEGARATVRAEPGAWVALRRQRVVLPPWVPVNQEGATE